MESSSRSLIQFQGRMNKNECFGLKPYHFYNVEPTGNLVKGFFGRIRCVKCPKPRSGHRIATDDVGNVYSFGGYNPHIGDDAELNNDADWGNTNPLFQELWKFCPSTLTWTKMNTTGQAPLELASHSALLINNHLVVYGGTGVPFGVTSSNKLYICNLEKLNWTRVVAHSDSNAPEEQYGQAITWDKEEEVIYVVGGTTGFRYTIDVHKFDLRTKTWSELWKKRWGSNFPQERYRHEIVLYNKELYVFGGGTADACFDFKDVLIFNLKRNTWRSESTKNDENSRNGHPKNRRCHGCVQVGHQVFIVGGTNGSIICDDLWRLDLETMKWTEFENKMPLPVYFHSASVSPAGQMMIFGGVTSLTNSSRTNEMFSMWLNVPPLKELAWMALLHYCDGNRLAKLSKEALYKIGIPAHYIQRMVGSKTNNSFENKMPQPY